MGSPITDPKSADFIKPLRDEVAKTYAVRDLSQRVIKLYEAPLSTQDGEPCLVTLYEYTASNTVPTITIETYGLWNIAWEATIWSIPINGISGYTEP